MSAHLDRAQLLLSQSRPGPAEQELRAALSDDPRDPRAHALLARCLSEQGRVEAAETAARDAIATAPADAQGYSVLASVLLERQHYEAARDAVDQALRIEPEAEAHWGTLSAIHLQQSRWDQALEAAERGLHVNPEDVRCFNLRAMALIGLGRQDEAGRTVDAALAREPENALSHANQGWTSLHRGQPSEALEHFREALRLNPQLEWARTGLLQAMRARYVVYRAMLAYFLWMSRLSPRSRVGLLLSGYLLYRATRSLSSDHPGAAPFLWPVIWLYIGFVFLSWTAEPLFNLLLRLNRFGRMALNEQEIAASNWIAVGLVLAAGCLVTALITGQAVFYITAGGCGLMLLVLGGVFSGPDESGRKRRATAAVVVAAAGLAAVVLHFLGQEEGTRLALALFILGAAGFTWVVSLRAARS